MVASPKTSGIEKRKVCVKSEIKVTIKPKVFGIKSV